MNSATDEERRERQCPSKTYNYDNTPMLKIKRIMNTVSVRAL
jgi:hypothetical protein